jgi:DNA polymerase III subunit gamma/tau
MNYEPSPVVSVPSGNVVQEPEIKKKPEVKPKIVIEPDKSRITTPSLKDALKSVNKKTDELVINPTLVSPEEDEPVVLENEFTGEELHEKWIVYIANIKAHNPRMYATLKDRQPVLREDYMIEITLTNSTQQEVFNSNIRLGLLEFLRTELRNNRINLSINLEEVSHEKNLLYTPQDKFKYMAEQNPLLLKFKQEFNLDFE